MATLPGLRVGLTLDSATFVAETRRVNDSVTRLGRNVTAQNNIMQRSFGALTNSVKGFAVGLAGAIGVASISQMARLAKQALDSAGSLAELAQQAGVSARELQVLTLAGVQAGVNQQQLITSLGQFGKRVGEAAQGTGTLKDTLEQYGIAVHNGAGQTRASIDVLGDLADAVQGAGSAQEKLRLASEAFGARVGARLVPLLNEGAEGFKRWAETADEAGLILGDEFIAQADKASDSLATLQYAFQTGFDIGIVRAFADALDITTGKIAATAEAGRLLGEVIGRAFKFLTDSLVALGPILETTKQEFEAIVNFFSSLGVDVNPFGLAAANASESALQIAGLNRELEELAARKTDLESQALSLGLTPSDTDAIQAINEQIEATTKLRDEAVQQQEAIAAAANQQKQYGAAVNATTPAITEQADAFGTLAEAAETAEDKLKGALVAAQLDQQVSKLDEAQQELAKTLRSVGVEFEVFDNQIHVQAELYPVANRLLKIYREEEKAIKAQNKALNEQKLIQRVDVRSDPEANRRMGQLRSQQRMDEAQKALLEDELSEPFKNALQDIQNEFTTTFDEISHGTIRSFEDMAESVHGIFTRMSANIASLAIFDPEGFDKLAANASRTTGLTPGTSGNLLAGAAFATPAVGLLTGLFGNQGAQEGLALGGGVGTAAGGLLGLALGGPGGAAVGSLAGGLLGSIGGSLFGGLFGGGDSDKTKGSFSGGIGNARFGGSSEISNIVKQVDKEILSLLDSRQRAAVGRLKDSGNISVSGGLSASDVESIGSSRIGATAQALGFNRGAILRGDTEQALKNLQTAIATERAIQDLTDGVSTFDRQVEDLSAQFAELRSTARQFGISLDGVAEANTKAYRELVKAQDAQIAALLDPFDALSGPLEAFQRELEFAGVGPIERFRKAQEEFAQLQEEAGGGSIEAFQNLEAAGRTLIELAGQVGSSPAQAQAIRDVTSAVAEALERVDAAEREAAEGIEDVVARASRAEIDTLRELINEVREVSKELRRQR